MDIDNNLTQGPTVLCLSRNDLPEQTRLRLDELINRAVPIQPGTNGQQPATANVVSTGAAGAGAADGGQRFADELVQAADRALPPREDQRQGAQDQGELRKELSMQAVAVAVEDRQLPANQLVVCGSISAPIPLAPDGPDPAVCSIILDGPDLVAVRGSQIAVVRWSGQ